jgi:hypothetical protein
MDSAPLDIAHVVQSAVAPVFLLTGVAATLSVLVNRLARAVDRARTLEQRLDQHQAEGQHFRHELSTLARRARYINAAISMCAISALCVAIVVVMLFANAFFAAHLAAAIALLFTAAMLLLSGAFVAFFIEVRLATAALRIGVPTAAATARSAREDP